MNDSVLQTFVRRDVKDAHTIFIGAIKLIDLPQKTWEFPFSNVHGFAGIRPGSCENIP